MPDNESTTKFRVDISELKKEFREAQRTIQLVNSEFKAATAGMGKWSSSADGLSAKVKQLNGVLEAEETKLGSLEAQYKLVAETEGTTSKGAQELMIRINNQKAAVEKVRSSIGYYSDKLSELKNESSQAETATEKLRSAINEQESDLESLKAKYANLVIEQGKSSEEAKTTAKEIQRLSTELQQNKSALSEAEGAANKLDHSLEEVDSSVEGAGEGFTVLKGAVANLAAAGVQKLVGSLKEFASESDGVYSDFQAKTGASAAEMQKFRKEMDELYKNNYGESLQDVGNKMAYVKQVTGETDPSKIKELTENAIALEDTFGSDFNETLRGVQNLMNHFGISAQEAFDLFAKGSQKGLDYTDELGDNVAEYGGNFKQAGYSADEYFQLLENGTKNGAYNLDKVNDSINEVKNRLGDGTIGKNISMFGKDTQTAFKAWASGKGTMKDVIDSIVKDINNCTSEQDALNMAATAFGTMGEDANLKVVKSLTTTGSTFKNVKGTMEDVKNVKYEDVKNQFTQLGRTVQMDFVAPLAQKALPGIKSFVSYSIEHMNEIIPVASGVGAALGTIFVANKAMAFVETLQKTAVMFGLVSTATNVATGSQIAFNTAVLANPVTLAVAGVAALTAGIVAYAVKTGMSTEKTDANTAATSKLISKQKELTKTLKDSSKSRKEHTEAAQEEGAQADLYYSKLSKLMGVEKKSASQKGMINYYVAQLNKTMPGLNLKYDEEKDKLNKSTQAIRDNIAAQKELLLAKAAQENLEKIAGDIVKTEAQQGDMIKQNTKNQEAYTAAQKKTEEARKAWSDSGMQAYGQEYDAYLKAVDNEEEKKKAYEKTTEAVEKNKKQLEELNTEYNKTEKYAQGKINAAEIEKQLSSITEKMKKKGKEIPKAVSDGIKAGQYEVPTTVAGMENLIKFDSLAKSAKLSGVKIPQSLSEGISSGKVSAQEAIKALKQVSKFDGSEAVQSAKEAGIKVPESLREGIASGKTSVQAAEKQLQDAVNFNNGDLITKAKEAGIKVPDSLAAGIASGKMSVKAANKQIQSAIGFKDTLTKAGITGKQIPKSLTDGVVSGKTSIEKATKLINSAISFNDAAKAAGQDGTKTVKNLTQKILAGKISAEAAGKKLAKATVDGEQKGGAGSKSTGQKNAKNYVSGTASQTGNAKKKGSQLGKSTDSGAKSGASGMKKSGAKAGGDYATGVGSKKGEAQSKGKSLANSAKSGSGSVSAKSSGVNFSQGFINGVVSLAGAAWEAAKKLAKKAWDGLKKGQKEGSPSKLTRQSGVYFGQGYNNGINSMIKEVTKSAADMGISAYRSLRESQQEHSPSKVTYKSGVNFSKGYINGIASQEKALEKTVKNLVTGAVEKAMTLKNFDFSTASSNASTALSDALEKKITYINNRISYKNDQKLNEIDKTINAYQSKMDKVQSAYDKKKKKTKADKKNYKNQIATYKKLIAKETAFKEQYQNASSQMMSEFSSALSDYQTKAQTLIDNTINGITDKYQTQYDDLVSKQDTLIDKLKGAGDLFEVSSAGIMTVNDIKQQTKDIKEYAEKLKKIKGKVSSELFDQIASYDMDQGSAFMDRLLALSDADLKAYSKAYTEKMSVSEKLAKDIYKSDFSKVASGYKSAVEKAFKDLPDKLEKIGTQAMKGFVSGLSSNTDYMSKSVRKLINGMIKQFKKELKIHSPSKVMAEIGNYTGQGVGVGLLESVRQVQKDAKQFLSSIASPLESMPEIAGSMRSTVNRNGIAGATTQNQTIINNYNLVQNNTSPKSLSALETYRARRQQVSMVKAMTQPV